MSQEETLKKVLEAANNIGSDVRNELFGGAVSDDFVLIDQTYPEIITTGEVIPSREESAAAHAEYLDRISKMLLTNSLFLGLGIEAPEGHSLTEAAADKFIAATGGSIYQPGVDADGVYGFEVLLGDATYQFGDTDRWSGKLRALHFLTLRHDPELEQVINRKLAYNSGIDEDWVASVRETAKK